MSAIEQDEERKNELKGFSIGESGKRNIPAPEGYFDQLPEKIIQRWHKEKNQPQARSFGLRRMIAAAAIVSGICIGITLLTKQPDHGVAPAEITSIEAYQYILEYADDFAPLIFETGQQAEVIQPESPEQIDPAINESNELEEYLLEEMESEDFETLF